MTKTNQQILEKNITKIESVFLSEKIPINQRHIRNETKLHAYTVNEIIRILIERNKIKRIRTSGSTFYIWNDNQ